MWPPAASPSGASARTSASRRWSWSATESLGPFLPYIQPNQSLQVEFLDGAPVEVKYPASVELVVDTTPDPIHSDDSNVFKAAILENGMEAQVPQFVKSGDTIRIEVETGKYLERVL